MALSLSGVPANPDFAMITRDFGARRAPEPS
jgi:hypothetical protein